MKGASRMYVQQTLWGTHNATSSQGSAAGRMPSASQDGPTTGPYGPDPALASLTPRQALERGMTTRGPYGGRGAGSSTSVDLQLSLASRLRTLMDVDGSPEYERTWSQWDMPWGPPICRLRGPGWPGGVGICRGRRRSAGCGRRSAAHQAAVMVGGRWPDGQHQAPTTGRATRSLLAGRAGSR